MEKLEIVNLFSTQFWVWKLSEIFIYVCIYNNMLSKKLVNIVLQIFYVKTFNWPQFFKWYSKKSNFLKNNNLIVWLLEFCTIELDFILMTRSAGCAECAAASSASSSGQTVGRLGDPSRPVWRAGRRCVLRSDGTDRRQERIPVHHQSVYSTYIYY